MDRLRSAISARNISGVIGKRDKMGYLLATENPAPMS
jgi:hypothetical protein